MSGLRGQLLVVALVAAVGEVLLLRIALRLGPVLPTQVDVQPVFAVVEWLGVVALNAGVLAGSALVGLASLEALRRGPRWAPLAFSLLGAVAVNLGLGSLVELLPAGMVGVLQAAVTGTAIVLIVHGSTWAMRERLVLVLVGTAQVLALAQPAIQHAASTGDVAGAGARSALAAEAVAVVAALALPWLLRATPRRIELAAGMVAGFGVAAAAATQPWGLATVAIWTMAFSLYLPPALYGAAVTSVLVTVLALRRQPGQIELLAGLMLVWLAGLKLDVSSFAVMGLTGLAIASRATPAATVEPKVDGTLATR